MNRFSWPSSFRPAKPLLVALTALAALSAHICVAQSGGAERELRRQTIRVTVKLDPSKTGQDRCSVEPEELEIPPGVSNVTWSLELSDPGKGSDAAEARLDTVAFTRSVPIVASERVDAQRWQATFDRESAFPETPYDVFVREADGTILDCYPHIAGSADQGGGG